MGARCLIIGLDGADWSIVDKLVSVGRLPNIQRLIERGARADLNSTTPPMTLPSWSSMLTGCHPGTHGIFDFVMRDSRTDNWTLQFVNANHRGVPTIHEWLSMQGKRVASIAVPTTWPPYPVNGVMVSGFDSPVSTGIDGSFCHPPEIYDELQRRFGGLKFADFQESVVDSDWLQDARRLLLSEIDRKQQIGTWLLEQEEWDCFMLLFGESDTASHHFWRFYDEESPRYVDESSGLKGTIPDVYERLDTAVGVLVQQANAEVVCICSDHGFGGSGTTALYLNRFLEEKGWLQYSQIETRKRDRMLDWMRTTALSRIPASVQGKLFRLLPEHLKSSLETATRFGMIDFSKTLAVSDEMNYAATIRLNIAQLSSERQHEIITELRKDLLSWRVNGQQPVSDVWHRADLFEGDYVHRSPELILELNLEHGYTYTLLPSVRVAKGTTWRTLEPSEWQGGKGLGMNGSHRQYGVLLLTGNNIHPIQTDAEMADIAPTLLAALGESIPSYMEGSVLSEIFERSIHVTHVEYEPNQREEHMISNTEHGAIRSRLEKLGYL